MKTTLSLLTVLLLALPGGLHAQTMSDLAQPAKRSPRAPKYEDICFSPRWTWVPNVVEAAKALHATRTEWVYVDDESGPVLQQLRDLGISLGLALACPPDTTERIPTPFGQAAKPQYYVKGRMLDIDGNVAPWAPISVHDPDAAEVQKKWLRLCAKFGAERIHRDGLEPFSGSQWDFNPHALSRFNAWLAAQVPSATLAQLGVGDPENFDLKAYIRGQKDGKTVPPEFKRLWENFSKEAQLAFYHDLRRWSKEIVGPDVEWCGNYSSFWIFSPFTLWTDYMFSEVQYSGTGHNGGQFSIGDPWSMYRKAQIARELGKALVCTLGSHDVLENKIMIGLTYAMGMHMVAPFAVYIPGKPRKYDDHLSYVDVYDFVHRWGKTYLANYEEAFALGNGITNSRTAAPLTLDDPADAVYAFVRARPKQPDAPVVIHLLNWNNRSRGNIALTLDPDRFFPNRGLKLTLLRPNKEPQVISDGWQARVELPAPEPWAMLIAEAATPNTAKVWAPEVETESMGFFDRRSVALRSRTTGASIHYTTDGSEPSLQSPQYERPIEISRETTLKARAYSGGQASPVSVFVFAKQPANNLAVASSKPGLNRELRRGLKVSKGEDLDDPMMWAGGVYQFDTTEQTIAERIVLPANAPKTMFAVVFDGLIDIPEDGLYTFFVNADDECRLEIDGKMVINLTGRKQPPDLGMTELQGRRLLAKGLHKLRIQYLQRYHAYGLEVQWQGPGITKQPIAESYLQH